MKKLVLGAGGVLAVGLGLVLAAAPAQADVSGGSNGFTVSVHVNVSSGGGDPVPSGGITISVPAKCYWGPTTNFDGTDAAAMQKDYDEYMDNPVSHSFETMGGYYNFPSEDRMKEVIAAEKAGTDYTWYQLSCREGVNGAKEGYTSSRENIPAAYDPDHAGDPFAVGYAAFPAGQGPPEPLVDVKDLTQSLWDVASAALDQPTMDRNPTITAANNGTLVNIPTWFWVTNPAQSLADDGLIDITASIPGSPVRTHLTAKTGDISVSSDAGSTSCSATQVQKAYTRGAGDDGSCSFPFERANRAGWDVRTLITWTGEWDGVDNDGADGGQLAPVTLVGDTNVPVTESQALVDQANGVG
jgi:hypothetical protein